MEGRSESFIFELARSAQLNIAEGYYESLDKKQAQGLKRRSLKKSIAAATPTPIIAEIKFKSPAEGKLRPAGDVKKIARAYERGGVAGISVLTEPRHFDGDIRYLPLVKKAVKVPVLMKDIIIDPLQIDAGADMGADAVLFIAAVFMNRLAKTGLDKMFERARDRNLEVLFEAHTENEYRFALESEADLVGINNRDLETLDVSLETSRRLLASGKEMREQLRVLRKDKPVISESGISSPGEIEQLKAMGADGFLVGSAIMKSSDLEAKVRSLRSAPA